MSSNSFRPPAASNQTEVFAVHGADPEILAYAMAKYSRSALSMRESLTEISAQRAEQFLNTFYFQYGHRSIADMAHVPMALENISLLAAIEVVDEQRLGAHHVGDRDDRKVEPVRLAGLRMDGGGAGRTHAAAKDVRTNDEKSIGVERAAGTDHCLPPPRPAGDRMQVADMLVAGQGVTKENGVGFRRVESAVCLVGDGQRRQRHP